MRRRGKFLAGMSVVALVGFGVLGIASSSVGAAISVVPFPYSGATQTYTVPSDGSVCSVTVDVVGANGATGAGGFSVGSIDAASVAGVGGTAQATFAVSPGDVLTVDVGGSGGAASNGTGGGAAFGGGGVGGNGGSGGGGGGGATTVKDNGSPLLVAGGGGGSAQFYGNGGTGGNGGSAGGDGTQGGSGGQGGLGQGGTTSTGGAGGAAGGPNATAGTAGTADTGGTGGNTTNVNSSGGGGGGGGYFGGGGGGAADNGGSGGGGGGGAGFAALSATGLGTSSLTQDGSGNGVAQIAPAAGACPPVLNVKKLVTGAVPTGTTFTVHVQCSHIVLTDVQAQASQASVNEDLVFDSSGNPVSGNPRVVATLTDTCNVTETVNGGAVSVSYACNDNATAAPALCQTTNQDVQFGRTGSETATVTVTNTFPAAGPIVVIAPKFTG